MDAAIVIAASKVEPSTSGQPDSVEQFLTQANSVQLMQYSSDPAQIGRQITQSILASSAPETVLQQIADALGEIFQADAFLIAAGTGQDEPRSIVYWCDRPDVVADPQALLQHPVIDAVIADVEPLAISDIQAIEVWQSAGWLWGTLPIRAILGISTRFLDGGNGAIVVGRSQPNTWTDWEKEMLKVVSESVAIAMSQVHLQQQVRTAAQYQTVLNQLTTAIRSSLDLDQILQMAIAGTSQALQVDRGLLLLLKYIDPPFKNRSLQAITKAKATVACEWLNQEAAGCLPSWLNHSFCLSDCNLSQQAFVEAPQPLAIANTRDLPLLDLESNVTSIFNLDAMPAILMVPLENQGTVLGFLVLQHHQPRCWHPAELELTNWVSAQASNAIIQSQTLRHVQALVSERTAQLQRSLEVQAKLYEKTRQQIDQLRHLNQLKDEFLSTMSHELRTPLTKMALAIRMLRQVELPRDRREKYLEILEQQCTQEINLINDLLDLQQLESKKSHFQPQKIDLKHLIGELAGAFTEQWADKGLRLEVDLPQRSLLFASDFDSLNHILRELLTNAGKYSEPDSIVRLQVTHEIDRAVSQIVFSVCNTGSGISLEEQTHIFEKFWRGSRANQQVIPGTGLGLALVKCLVQHLNGTITVSSCPTEEDQFCETCFTITLPQSFDRITV